MDPINPWLDPVEVRRLAERLMTPLRNPDLVVSDAGFDPVFVGYEAMRPVVEQQPTVWPASSSSHVVMPAEIVAPPTIERKPEHTEEPPAVPFQAVQAPVPGNAARGPFLDRINRLSDWLKHNFSATDIFILDREGAVIFDESGHGKLHFLARSLALASRRPGEPAENVHVKVGAGATLEVIPVETPYGCLVLGAVVPDSLTPASVSAVKDAIIQVASPR